MPETARIYGLSIDRWVDQRLAAPLATDAAAELPGRSCIVASAAGSWRSPPTTWGTRGSRAWCAGTTRTTSWSLARTEGTLPWETTLYVPKILAAAVVAHNLVAFWDDADIQLDPPLEADEV